MLLELVLYHECMESKSENTTLAKVEGSWVGDANDPKSQAVGKAQLGHPVPGWGPDCLEDSATLQRLSAHWLEWAL